MSYTRNPRSGVTSLTTFNGWYQGCCTGNDINTECCLGSTFVNTQKYYKYISNIGSIKDCDLKSLLASSYLCFYMKHLKTLIPDSDDVKQKRENRIKEIQKMLECIKRNSCIIQKLPDVARVAAMTDDTELDGGIFEDTYQPAVNFIDDNLGYVVLNTIPTLANNRPIGTLSGQEWYVLGDSALIKWDRDEFDEDAWKYDFWYWDYAESGLPQYFRTVVDDRIESHVAFLRPCWRTKVNYKINDPDAVGVPVPNNEYSYYGFKVKASWIYDGEEYIDENHPILSDISYIFNDKFSLTDFPSSADRDKSTNWTIETVRGNSNYEFFRPNNDCIVRSVFRPITLTYTDTEGNNLSSSYYTIDWNNATVKSIDLSYQYYIDREFNITINLPNRPLEFDTNFNTRIVLDQELSNENHYNVNANINYTYDEGVSNGRNAIISNSNTTDWNENYTSIQTTPNTHDLFNWRLHYLKQDVSEIKYWLDDHHVIIDGNRYKTSSINYHLDNDRIKTRDELDMYFKDLDRTEFLNANNQDITDHIIEYFNNINDQSDLSDTDSQVELINAIEQYITNALEIELEDARYRIDSTNFSTFLNNLFNDNGDDDNVDEEELRTQRLNSLVDYIFSQINMMYNENYTQPRNMDEYIRVENDVLLIPVDKLADFDLQNIYGTIDAQVYKFNRYCFIENRAQLQFEHPWYAFYFDSIFKDYDNNDTTDTHYHQDVTVDGLPDSSRHVGLLEDCRDVTYKAKISDDPIIAELVEPYIEFKYYKADIVTDINSLNANDEISVTDWRNGVTISMFNEDLNASSIPNELTGINTNIVLVNSVPDFDLLPKLHLRFNEIHYGFDNILDVNGIQMLPIPIPICVSFESHHLSNLTRAIPCIDYISTTSQLLALDSDTLTDAMLLMFKMNAWTGNLPNITYELLDNIVVQSETHRIIFSDNIPDENISVIDGVTEEIKSFYDPDNKTVELLPQNYLSETNEVEDIEIIASVKVSNEVAYFQIKSYFTENASESDPTVSFIKDEVEFHSHHLVPTVGSSNLFEIFQLIKIGNNTYNEFIININTEEEYTATILPVLNQLQNDDNETVLNIYSDENNDFSQYDNTCNVGRNYLNSCIRANENIYGNGSYENPYKIIVVIDKITE